MKDIPKEQMGPFYDRNTYLDDEKLYEYCVEKHLSWTSPELEKGEEGFEQNIKELIINKPEGKIIFTFDQPNQKVTSRELDADGNVIETIHYNYI